MAAIRTKTRLLAGFFFASIVAGASAQPTEPRPDLIIKSLEVSHDRLAPDTVVLTKLEVANRGATAAPAFRIAIYHSDGLVVPRRGNVTRIGNMTVHNGLGRGASATFSLPVRIPPCERCLPGSVYAYADAWGTVLEQSEENNFKAVPISVHPSYLPNLSVEGVTLAPDRGAMGSAVTLRATLKNESEFVAQGPVRVGLFCSADHDVDPADTLLGSWVVPELPRQGAIALERKLRVDSRCGVRGQHTQIGLLVDMDQYVKESDEQDNGALAPFWVFRAPDLAPGEVLVAPNNGPPGAAVLISFVVKNEGKAAAGPFKVGIYSSSDAHVTTSDTLIEVFELPSLGAGKTTGTLHRELSIPTLPSGDYYVGVVVDVDGANGELREHNNMTASRLQVRRVNLTDGFFFVDKSAARAGDELELEFTLRNTGTDAARTFDVGFYYSDDPRLDAKDVKIGGVAFGRLAPGREKKSHRTHVKLPLDARDGHRFVLMATDDTDAVNELDEHDNLALRAVLIGSEVRRDGGPRP